jgi:TatD DNase family protein
MITFRMADNVRESAAALPLSSMMVETDAPYLAPAPFRGKPNEPSYVARTAAKLAEVKGVPLSAVADATTANFLRLFGTS